MLFSKQPQNPYLRSNFDQGHGLLMKLMIPMMICLAGFGAYRAFTVDVSEDARNWARSMGYENASVVCQSFDNDGDSKISCDVKTDDRIIPLNCSIVFRGCTQRVVIFPG